MIEKIWFESHWVTYLAAPVLWPLSKLFGMMVQIRRNAFITESCQAFKAPVPVIIVGNISVGGNGKTPMVLWLVEQLQAQGMKPGVISRGYGGKAKHYPLLIDSNTQPQEAGDEPVLIYQRTAAFVSVSPDRQAAINQLLALGVNIIISDDGLQHYKLARDLEIVVIDGARRFGNGHYLPFGPLRELPSRLHSIDILVCNGAGGKNNEETMTLVAQDFINLHTGNAGEISALSEVVAIAGIGHPSRFFKTLTQLGVTLSQTISFTDHQNFSANTLVELKRMNKPVVMTEKDAVKCRRFVRENAINNWWYLPIDAHFSMQSTERILQKIHRIREDYGSSIAGNSGLPKL